MKKITFSLLTATLLVTNLMAGGAEAPALESVTPIPAVQCIDNSGAYVGLGISAVIAYEDESSFFDSKVGQDRTGDFTLLAGYAFNQYVAVEGRYMSSYTHEDSFERDAWGVYVKPQYPIMEELKVYGLLGYGGFKLDGINGSGIDIDENGFQWGFGASYEMTEHFSIFADYLKIASDVNVDRFVSSPAEISSDAVTVGVTYKF